MREPIYPIYRAVDESGTVVAESEMLGNIFNQVGKALERGATHISIDLTDRVVDARVPFSGNSK